MLGLLFSLLAALGMGKCGELILDSTPQQINLNLQENQKNAYLEPGFVGFALYKKGSILVVSGHQGR